MPITDLTILNMELREIVNGALLPLSLFLAGAILVFMIGGWSKARYEMRAWRTMPGISTACTLFWVFFAEGLRSGTVWFIYRSNAAHSGQAHGATAVWSTFMFLLTGMILMGAMLKGIHLFTPPKYSNLVWSTAVTVTLGFLLVSYLTQ